MKTTYLNIALIFTVLLSASTIAFAKNEQDFKQEKIDSKYRKPVKSVDSAYEQLTVFFNTILNTSVLSYEEDKNIGKGKTISYDIYFDETVGIQTSADKQEIIIPLEISLEAISSHCYGYWTGNVCKSSPGNFGSVYDEEFETTKNLLLIFYLIKQEDGTFIFSYKGLTDNSDKLLIEIEDEISYMLNAKEKLENPLQEFFTKNTKKIQEILSCI